MAVHRIEVRPKAGVQDSRGTAVSRDGVASGLLSPGATVEVANVYLIEGELREADIRRIADELLADPVMESATIGARTPTSGSIVEVHPLPGVMDPDAEAVELGIRALLGVETSVRTGRRYDLVGASAAESRRLAERVLANTMIHAVHEQPYVPREFPAAASHGAGVRDIPLLELNDEALARLSRDAHLFLSLDEIKAIQQHYRSLGREPREIELETIAQTWSEHCVHKTLKSTIRYVERDAQGALPAFMGLSPAQVAGRPGHTLNADGSVTIHNLLKSTIAAATHELIADGVDWCLSVFVDNSGIIAFDDHHAVCFKCETHNHPSALEPYGGAATGIGGVFRDIIGTGLGAKPIAATDIFCVAHPDHWKLTSDNADNTKERTDLRGHSVPFVVRSLPQGVLHPRRILSQVVAGVRDYGNRMGIPTLNGLVWFDDDYVGNPLVFCGCIGVMPRDMIRGRARPGDRIIAMGGRTGRDGIHGATFSSAELTDSHADEFSHAVQIGNAVTEKKLLDATLAARDHANGCLYHAITDCGAGGFSSAIGEMGAELGAFVQLERAPLKYDGLSPAEIWISEAQERMILAVAPECVDDLAAVCEACSVELCDLGHFGTDSRELILTWRGVEYGRLSMSFLHDGLPELLREATWGQTSERPNVQTSKGKQRRSKPTTQEALLGLLAHPNIASKRWIIRQYDHEVQGRTVVKPLVGRDGQGPSDGSVILPVPGSNRGLAIACGLATNLRDDPYVMALAAIDECVRNLVCVGADPSRIAILDNFCWPSCNDPRQLGALVRAAEGCYDGAKAYRTPFISGKDSLNNQFTTDDGRTIRIPPTLLISGIGIVPDVRRCVTMDAKRAGNVLLLLGDAPVTLASSHFDSIFGCDDGPQISVDAVQGARIVRAVHALLQRGMVKSIHDVSDGGWLVAVAEMLIGGGLGLDVDERVAINDACFAEGPSRFIIEVEARAGDAVRSALDGIPAVQIGALSDAPTLRLGSHATLSLDDLRSAFLGTLDW
jgi:phosphoribosylformylglycinamidine synthase